MRGIPPPFRWFTKRREGIESPDEKLASYQTDDHPTKRPSFEVASWSEFNEPLTVEADGTLIAPLCGTSSQRIALTGHSPFRPLPARTQRTRYPAPVGRLTHDARGWTLETHELSVNGAPPAEALRHGDVIETTDQRTAWVVLLEARAPDTRWGPLWRASSRGQVRATETATGLAVTLEAGATDDSLELLRRIMQSSLAKRLASLALTVASPDEFAEVSALVQSHRALAPPFALELHAEPTHAVETAGDAPHALLVHQAGWKHVALKSVDALWLLDLGTHHVRLEAATGGVTLRSRTPQRVPWLQAFFIGDRLVSLVPRRSAFFAGAALLQTEPTPASVRVFVDELLERGDPAATLLRAALDGNVEPLSRLGLFSNNPLQGGIDLARSEHVGGLFTALHLTPWSGWEADVAVLLTHPLLRHVRRVSGRGLPTTLRSAFPAIEVLER